MADEVKDDQAQNEEVEETTEEEPTPETEEETPEEQPEEKTEETPAEEEESKDEPESKDEGEAKEEAPEAEKPSRKGKGLEARHRGLLKRLHAQQQPQTPQITPQQAAKGVADLEAYASQNQGQLPAEISVEDYNHLVSIRDSVGQAQADVQSAEVAQLRQEMEVEKRTREVEQDIQEAVETHDVLNKASSGYDQEFDDLVSDDLEESLKENPYLNVRRFIDSKVRVYQKAKAKGGASTAQSRAEQAAKSALPAQGRQNRKDKSDKEKTVAELEAEIAAKHGVY